MANCRDKSNDEAVKAEFIEALMQNHGNLFATYTSLDIPYTRIYKWRKEDPEFEEKIKECKQHELRWVESKLYERIQQGNADKLIQFYLKTQGKNDGWQEVQKVEADVKGSMDVEKTLQEMAEKLDEDVPF